MDDRRRGGGREVVFIAGGTWTSQKTTCKTSGKTTGVAAGSRTAKTTGKDHEILFLKVHFIHSHFFGFLFVGKMINFIFRNVIYETNDKKSRVLVSIS